MADMNYAQKNGVKYYPVDKTAREGLESLRTSVSELSQAGSVNTEDISNMSLVVGRHTERIESVEEKVIGTHKEFTLWENASPNSDFPAQNITINNMSEYKYFMCYFSTNKSALSNLCHIIDNVINQETKVQSVFNMESTANMGVMERKIIISDGVIGVNGCLRRDHTDSQALTDYSARWLKLLKIVGVKEVV